MVLNFYIGNVLCILSIALHSSSSPLILKQIKKFVRKRTDVEFTIECPLG